MWRSFFIEMDCHNTDKIMSICNWLQDCNIRFCFQRYGEWTRHQRVFDSSKNKFGTKDVIEPEHVSFRIIARDINEITDFREYLRSREYVWTEGSWDEEWRVKKAYEVGTKLWLVYIKEMRELEGYGEIGNPENFKGFVLQMLHGFFNGLDAEYGDEEILLSNYLAGLLKRNGFGEGVLNHLKWLNTCYVKDPKKE